MRIVIDMQGAQTESRFRGIGRYSLSFAKAIVRNGGEHEIILALNGLFPETIETIRATFAGLLPQGNIRTWYAPGPLRECNADNKWRREVAELIREAFLLSLKPDIVHLTSLFEGYVDDAATSIGCLQQTVPVSVLLHDLIPLINPGQYLRVNPGYGQYYMRKIGHLHRATVLLSNSESTRVEGHKYLGGEAGVEIYNISSAAEEIFKPVMVTDQQQQILLKKFAIEKPFVMYAGGEDERKNLPRLVRAFSKLPQVVRQEHQLVFAGKIAAEYISYLQEVADESGLEAGEYCFTGYVQDEELVQLYNLCKLFIFPSRYEGFGLPVLEAMSCGAVVIGSNTTSVPEVIGMDAALFDPYSEQAITDKMTQALLDEEFRQQIVKHGSQQALKFSWDHVARRALEAFGKTVKDHSSIPSRYSLPDCRPKLAYISPLPPERSGIADYSAELLPELACYYDIEVIVAQDSLTDPFIKANFLVRTVSWFEQNANRFDRILYHFGNSPYHEHMFGLLQQFPGTVVLHDFFLSSIQFYRENNWRTPYAGVESLYLSHGFYALKEHCCESNVDVIAKYPCNFEVLQYANGVIVHSQHSKKLSQQWYGENLSADWKVIPLLRRPSVNIERSIARQALGLQEDDFIVCSFGMLDSTKQNHCLLQAWIDSLLAASPDCRLIFVGENHGGEYGHQLQDNIKNSGLQNRIQITGWVDTEQYIQYLSAADLAVQLRTLSRGETSAAVLDCMNYALPTIINANGSMAEIPDGVVKVLPDEFELRDLIDALECLWKNRELCHEMGELAQKIIWNQHSPNVCARQYWEAIESFYRPGQGRISSLVPAIAKLDCEHISDSDLKATARTISLSLPLTRTKPQLLVDVSATCRNDLQTGIERVAHSIMLALIEIASEVFKVEPVYLSDEGGVWHYRYARQYTLDLLGCPAGALIDNAVLPQSGDLLLGVDLSGNMLVEANKSGLFVEYKNIGVGVYFIVFDLLPISFPQFFPPGADRTHQEWLKTVSHFDGAICISRDVASKLQQWTETNNLQRCRPFKIDYFHLGADVDNLAATAGLPREAEVVLSQFERRPSFLMVGTIEPRKGYQLVLDAFTLLWQQGLNVNLIIVGREGWVDLPVSMRQTIPETIEFLRSHPEQSKRLFWLKDCSDEYLEKIYAASSCLIAASEGEGFGLPLIEAAQHKLPIIARDIPVFREVAGDYAYYFAGGETETLAAAIKDWLHLFKRAEHPRSDDMPWQTWKQSAQQLMKRILGDFIF